MAIIRSTYSSRSSSSNNKRVGYTAKCIRNMYINLLGLFMDKLNGIIISSNGSI